MKKAIMWIRLAIYLPAIWLTALQSRRESFATRFSIMAHWAKMIVKRANVKPQVENVDSVSKDETTYFVCNHQGSLDPFLVLAYLPVPATAVSKIENAKIPVIGTWLKTLEAILLDRSSLKSSLKMVKEVTKDLENHRNIVVFPEGTRSKSAKMGEFKAGALKPVFTAKCNIVVISLINTFVIDVKGKVDNRVKLVFSDPIKYPEYENLTTIELSEKIQKMIQNNLDKGL